MWRVTGTKKRVQLSQKIGGVLHCIGRSKVTHLSILDMAPCGSRGHYMNWEPKYFKNGVRKFQNTVTAECMWAGGDHLVFATLECDDLRSKWQQA